MGKIGILTQPLHDNYGGLLQAYALKEVLQSLNHEVVVINRRSPEISNIRLILSKLKKTVLNQRINPKDYLSDQEKRIISQHTYNFRSKYIPNITEPITNNSGMKELNSMGFDGYVVGSDQCWRPKYSPQIANYFLDFASNEQEIKRISYAASFGVSNWEFNEEDTFLCSKFAQKFNAISVREDSGVNLVKKYLKQEAVHVLDPTMLLDTGDYVRITENEKAVLSAGELKVYILDRSLKKGNIVEVLERRLGLRKFEVLPKKRFGIDKYDNIEDFIYPGPVQWLQGYRDAKFVITDSFHGTVFSILFNVPFLVIPNSSRGVARFESLLKVFGLEDRLINNIDDFDTEKVIDSAIDWEMVNEKLAQERTKAIQFLNVNLS